MSWIEKLKEKWDVDNNWQFFMIMLVFACTGMTIVLIKRPLLAWLFADGDRPLWFQILYWVFILPFYNVVLLCFGYLLGQWDFFWKYEQKMLRRFGIKTDASKK
ncbi:MAG: DUF6787 family protein [Bacteroidota bacterium]